MIYCAANDIWAFYLHKIAAFELLSFFSDLFTIVELCFFSWFFYLIIHNAKIKITVLLLAIAFVIFSIFLYLFSSKNSSFSSIITGVETILIIAMCIYYFFDKLKQPDTALIYTSTNFWIIISFLIYLSGTFFLYLYSDSNMLKNKIFLRQYIMINSSFNILKNVLLGIAMLMKPDKNNDQAIFPEDRLTADWDTNQSLHNLN
jgi:hypothetical protein